MPVDYDPSRIPSSLAQAAIAGEPTLSPHRMPLDARASDMVLAVFGDGDLGDPFEASRGCQTDKVTVSVSSRGLAAESYYHID